MKAKIYYVIVLNRIESEIRKLGGDQNDFRRNRFTVLQNLACKGYDNQHYHNKPPERKMGL